MAAAILCSIHGFGHPSRETLYDFAAKATQTDLKLMAETSGNPLRLAYWRTPSEGLVHLQKDWLETDQLPPLSLHPADPGLIELRSPDLTAFASKSGYWVDDGHLHFGLPVARDPLLGLLKEDVLVAGDFNKWNPGKSAKWHLGRQDLHGEDWLVLQMPKRFWADGERHQFKFVTESGRWLEPWPDAPNAVRSEGGSTNFQLQPERTGRHLFSFRTANSRVHPPESFLRWEADGTCHELPVDPAPWLYSLRYEGRLGAWIEGGGTVFALFAPQADSVEVILYRDVVMSAEERHGLERRPDGVWIGRIERNLDGCYYHFGVGGGSYSVHTHFDADMRILDPYCRATVGREGPGLIVDDGRLQPPSARYQPQHWHDLIIAECHVRDLIAKAPLPLEERERRGFSGLAKWVRSPECYLRELGVNAVELQPVQEFDNQLPEEYHWGYMPVNFFAPSSAYALDPARGSQIEEFRDCVAAFHEAGMAVILDVVYNHVGEPNHLLFIDKYYYFELEDDGKLLNWSGCGNDIKTVGPMARKLIIDSLVHFVETYDVDGFRLDLAELLGLSTLIEIERALKRVKPSIILIAEPWSFRGHIADQLHHTGWSSWNDGFRDFLRQYVGGDVPSSRLRHFLAGSPGLTRFPAQTVNYSESHDDHCWLDAITECAKSDAQYPTARDQRRSRIMFAVLLMALGIPMIAGGQDFLRSKRGVANTYQRGDLNALCYRRRQRFSGIHEWVRAWILFRQSHHGRLMRCSKRPTADYLRFYGEPDAAPLAVRVNADGSHGSQSLFFAVNPTQETCKFTVDDCIDCHWLQIADTERFNPKGLECAVNRPEKGQLSLPPESCGLWLLS